MSALAECFFGGMREVSGFLVRVLLHIFVPGQFCFRSALSSFEKGLHSSRCSVCTRSNSRIKGGHHYPYTYFEGQAEL